MVFSMGIPSKRKSKKPEVVGKGETFNMCLICMGMIKDGLAHMVCICKKAYHVSCGRRLGECPNCSTALTDEMIVGEDEEVEEVKIDYEAIPAPKLRLSPEEKIELLDERLILGELGEEVYKQLKAKYEREMELGAEAEGDEIYKCPSCNAIVDKDAEKCECGVILSQEEGFLCPECRNFVPYDSKVCTKCGVRFSEGEEFVCPSCKRQLEWGTEVCPCGTRFSDELVEGFYCPSCGKFQERTVSSCDSCGVIFSDSG